jgi:hypothetical protein
MIVGNQKMVQLRFGQCGVPVVCAILGPIVADGPQAGLWRPAAARPQPKQLRTEHNPGAFVPIDCSPLIDSLFAGSPINNRVPKPISSPAAIPASSRYRLRKGEFP